MFLVTSGLGRAWRVTLGALCALAAVALPAHSNPARTLAIYGYHADSDPDSVATFQAQGQRLDGIISTNFAVDISGRIEGTYDRHVLELARSRGTRVHARISNFVHQRWNSEVVHAILTVPDVKVKAQAEIVQLLDQHGYDGINLELQHVASADRRALTSFVAELAAQVHVRHKTLSVAVPPKLADRADDWTVAFDLAALARSADWLVITAYDEHSASSGPGPVASLPWVDAVIRFALREVPAQKFVLGVALYGYEWPATGMGEGISMREAVARARKAAAMVQWDEQNQVPYYRTGRSIVFFENAQSVELKLGLAARYQLAGVAVWRLGHELPDVWEAVGGYLRPTVRAGKPQERFQI